MAFVTELCDDLATLNPSIELVTAITETLASRDKKRTTQHEKALHAGAALLQQHTVSGTPYVVPFLSAVLPRMAPNHSKHVHTGEKTLSTAVVDNFSP